MIGAALGRGAADQAQHRGRVGSGEFQFVVEGIAPVAGFCVVMIVSGNLNRAEESLDDSGAIAVDGFQLMGGSHLGNEVAIIEQIFDDAAGIGVDSGAQGLFEPVSQALESFLPDPGWDLVEEGFGFAVFFLERLLVEFFLA